MTVGVNLPAVIPQIRIDPGRVSGVPPQEFGLVVMPLQYLGGELRVPEPLFRGREFLADLRVGIPERGASRSRNIRPRSWSRILKRWNISTLLSEIDCRERSAGRHAPSGAPFRR